MPRCTPPDRASEETNLRKERQLEGIAKAKAAGVYKGCKSTVDIVRVRVLKEEGVGPSAIAKMLGIGRASVYRALAGQVSEVVTERLQRSAVNRPKASSGFPTFHVEQTGFA